MFHHNSTSADQLRKDLPEEEVESSDSEFAAYEEESEEEEDSSALSGSDLNKKLRHCTSW